MKIAKKEVGKKEIPQGSNWGGDIPKYLKSVGIGYPAPWCMAFVFWTVDQYCKQKNTTNPLYPTGHVATQWQKCKFLRVDLTNDQPQPGDIFIIINRKTGTGHCGFVVKVENGYILTIEGNSNTTGSSEGYEVAEGKRKIKDMTGFIRVVR